MSARYTLASVANLDMADRIQRVARTPDADLSVTAWCDIIDDRQVWTAIPHLGYRDENGASTDRGIRYDSFELAMPRSQAARMIAREIRDWANDRVNGVVR